VCTRYGSSECFFGINLRPACDPSEVSYTIMPNMAYFEFLPIVDDEEAGNADERSRLVELAGVEAGREYELVVKPGREPTRSGSGRAWKKLELKLPSSSQLETAGEPLRETRLEPARSSVQNEWLASQNSRTCSACTGTVLPRFWPH
jgi:hypothetical protein